MNKIPAGISKEDVYIRRAIIVERLAPLIGKGFPCRAFKQSRVEFVFASIDETATHAAKRYESTLAALRIVEALRNAILVNTTNPHSNRQRKMNFVKVHELNSILDGIGEVKIFVGERKNMRILQYSITKNSITK